MEAAWCRSTDTIGIVNDFSASSASTAHPNTSIYELIPLVASLESDGQSELVCVRVDGVGNGGIGELLEHVFGTGAPAAGLDGDKGWRLIGSLEEVVCF